MSTETIKSGYSDKFTDKSVKLKKFIENCSYISILSSYYIFIARNEPSWTDPPFITPPNQ